MSSIKRNYNSSRGTALTRSDPKYIGLQRLTFRLLCGIVYMQGATRYFGAEFGSRLVLSA